MDGVLWALQGILAAVFLIAGSTKLSQPHERLVAGPMQWAEDFSPPVVRLAGVAEVAAAIGLILPPLLDIAPWLAPLAASGLVLQMIGAFYTHIRREEHHFLIINAVLMVLALVVAWGRFGPYSF